MDFDGTLIYYESPHRLVKSLKQFSEILGNRPAVVARELTKIHEEINRGCLLYTSDAADGLTGAILVPINLPTRPAHGARV